jgi:hypothetical protein
LVAAVCCCAATAPTPNAPAIAAALNAPTVNQRSVRLERNMIRFLLMMVDRKSC